MFPYPDINYLLVGHVALDHDPPDLRLGGTVSYAGLTAVRLDKQVGIVTRCQPDPDCSPLEAITAMVKLDSPVTTQFENTYLPDQRVQFAHQVAEPIGLDDIPNQWHNADIIHVAPIINEIDPAMLASLSGRFMGLTLQGWLRRRDEHGEVNLTHWRRLKPFLPDADAVILSEDDLDNDLAQAHEMARYCRLVVITQGPLGATVIWCGQKRQFAALQVDQVDPTGAGDIFAAAFFTKMAGEATAWEAAEFANHLATDSIRRRGLDGIPSPEWIRAIEQGKGS
jgi:sugar/nucleoside kinase (ribokinase family)